VDQKQISKIWSWIGIVAVYYSLDCWLVTQGGKAIFGSEVISLGRVPVALLAMPICSVLLGLASATAWFHAARARRAGRAWHARIPLAWLERARTGSPEGRIYQATVASVMVAVPLLALCHFWNIVSGAAIMLRESGERTGMWSWPTSLNDPARICTSYDPAAMDKCSMDVTFIPGIEPAVLAFIIALASLATAGFLWEVVRRKPAAAKS
jgi:hypothetical protein